MIAFYELPEPQVVFVLQDDNRLLRWGYIDPDTGAHQWFRTLNDLRYHAGSEGLHVIL